MKPAPQHPTNSSLPGFTISIVEDEPVLRQEMAFQLQHHGFAVETFESAASFYRYLAVQANTVAVLDIGLSGEDGLSICRHLRQHNSHIGIVFLTARGQREDRLTGLAIGADAYLVKPVDMDELVLVLKHLGQRFAPPPHVSHQEATAFGNTQWRLEPGSGFVVAPNGMRTRLSVSEGQVLRALLGKAGATCSHTELAVALDLLPDEFNKHRTEVIVSRLRSKVQRATGLELPVHSVRGMGYSIG